MKIDFQIPYERYALITELARRSPSLGRTSLQKKIYLLQTLFNVDLQYDFSLYTYGPFTSQLLSDLDAAEAIGAVRVNNIATGYGGYEIKPGDESSRIISKAEPFLKENEVKIDRLFGDFGNFNAKELELRATIIYVEHDLPESSNIEEIIETVKEIKPGFSLDQIKDAVHELVDKKYIPSTAKAA